MELISRDELREKLERADEFKLVMTLSAFAFRTKRIPTSLHFETVGEALAALHPTEEIVVYCADVHCAASIYAYRLFERAGYTHVRRYAGGVAAWEEAGYPLEAGPAESITDRVPQERSKPHEATARKGSRTDANRPWRICA